jgi:hypothetical protein
MNKKILKTINGIVLAFVFLVSVLLISNSIFADSESVEFTNLKVNGNSNISEEVFSEDMVLSFTVNSTLNISQIDHFRGYFMMHNNNGTLPLTTFEITPKEPIAVNNAGYYSYFFNIDFGSDEYEYIIENTQSIIDNSFLQENGDSLKIRLELTSNEESGQHIYTNAPYPEISYESNFVDEENEIITNNGFYISDLKQHITTGGPIGGPGFNQYIYSINNKNNFPFEFSFQSNLNSNNIIFKLVLKTNEGQYVIYNQDKKFIKSVEPITLGSASGLTSEPIAYRYKYKFNLRDSDFEIDDFKLVSGNYDLYLTVSQKISQNNVETAREDIMIDFKFVDEVNTLPEYTSYKAENLVIDVTNTNNVEVNDGYYTVKLGKGDFLDLTLSYSVKGLEDVELANAVFLKYKNDAAIFYPVLKDKVCINDVCTYTYKTSIYKSVLDNKAYKLEYRVYSAQSRNENLNYKTSINKISSTSSYSSEDIKVILSNDSEVLEIPQDQIIGFYSYNDSKIITYKTEVLKEKADDLSDKKDNTKVIVSESENNLDIYEAKDRNLISSKNEYLEKIKDNLKSYKIDSKYVNSISIVDSTTEQDTYMVEVKEPKKFLGLFNIGERNYIQKVIVSK